MKANEHRVNRLARQALVKLGKRVDEQKVHVLQLMRWALDEGVVRRTEVDITLMREAVATLEATSHEQAMLILRLNDPANAMHCETRLEPVNDAAAKDADDAAQQTTRRNQELNRGPQRKHAGATGLQASDLLDKPPRELASILLGDFGLRLASDLAGSGSFPPWLRGRPLIAPAESATR